LPLRPWSAGYKNEETMGRIVVLAPADTRTARVEYL
jgi:hypothetical protein